MKPTLPPSLPGTQLVHVGRQPIFDRTGDVVAYELLFRGSMDSVEAGRRDTYATSQVIVNTFTEFGIDEVVGDRTCFINMTREFLTGELVLPFGPEHVVLEVLETVTVDDEVVAGVAALVAQGYRIALDDFVYGSGHEQLLPLASYVKLDLLQGDLTHLDEIVAACRVYPDIQIVAEGLEISEHLALYRLVRGVPLRLTDSTTARREWVWLRRDLTWAGPAHNARDNARNRRGSRAQRGHPARQR